MSDLDIDLAAVKTQFQARINALNGASTLDQVLDSAVSSKQAVKYKVALDRANLKTELQRIANGVGAGTAIEDLVAIVSSTSGDNDSIPIGTIQKFGFAGDKFTDNNNYEWLLFGLLHSKTGYEKALKNPGTRAYGRQVYTAQANTAGRVTKAAEDGLGNIVIASGSFTHVIVSHDFGETLVAVPHNLPNRAVTVEYVGGHFVVACNNSDGIRTSYSADGGGSFSSATLARGLSAGIADTVRSSCSGTAAMFVVSNDPNALVKTSGTANSSITLPSAVNGGSYIPIVQFFNGAFYVAGKNVGVYYKTTNNGGAFSSNAKPIGSLIQEQGSVALGKFFWLGQSGSERYYKFTTDFVTWTNLLDVLPSYLVALLTRGAFNSTPITIFPVAGGLIINTYVGNFFTNDMVNYSLIHFSRSSTELAGSGAEYYCFSNLVLGGVNLNDGFATPLNSSVLKVNYSEPDYVGAHRDGLAVFEAGVVDYVRIK